MLRLKKSILGAALFAGLAAAVVTPVQSADARPVWGQHGHWVHTWHDGRYGWWWTGPDYWYWYPAPVYYDYPPAVYIAPPGPAPQPTWYYCDSAKGYYPYVRSCASGWRAVAADAQSQDVNSQPPAPPSGTAKS
jgi:hypothetical protein